MQNECTFVILLRQEIFIFTMLTIMTVDAPALQMELTDSNRL